MERAASAVVFAGFLEFHAPVYHVNDVDAIQQVIDKGLGYASCHAQCGARLDGLKMKVEAAGEVCHGVVWVISPGEFLGGL